MVSNAQIKAQGKWEKKVYDKVLVRIRKDTEPTRDTITSAAESVGLSLNAYIMEAVKEKMEGKTGGAPELVPELNIYAKQLNETPEEYTKKAIKERMERQDQEAEQLEHIPFFE